MTLEERRVIWNRRKELKRKKMIGRLSVFAACFCMMLIFAFLMFGKVKAGEPEVHYEKVYTTITVETNETLWTIADRYDFKYDSKYDYIEEVVFINNLKDSNDIKSGETLVVPYYSSSLDSLF